MIRGAVHCAKKELRIRLRDRWALVMWFVVPLAIGGMITALAGGGDGPQPTATLLVADEDQSFLSQLMIGALGQSPVIETRAVERDEGDALITRGEGSAFLIVPPGFADNVLNERPAALELVTNPAQQFLPGIVEEFLAVIVDGMFYLQRVFGDQIQTINEQLNAVPAEQTQIFEDAVIAQLSVSFNAAVESLVADLDPLLLTVVEAATEDDTAGPSFALLFFPGTIFMGLLFASQGLSNSFWREREDGTLRRTVVSPLTLGEIFGGKLLSGAALLFLLAGTLAGIGIVYHDLGLTAWLPVALWLTLSGLVLFGLMALLQLLAPSRKSASLITNILVFPLMMAGGAFFPSEALPEWLSAIGLWVPNGFLLERLKAYLIYDGGLAALASGLSFALAMAISLWALCAWRLRAFARVSE